LRGSSVRGPAIEALSRESYSDRLLRCLAATDAAMVGEKKTRAMTAWAEPLGFATSLQERMFAADFKREAHYIKYNSYVLSPVG
jgi:hypothetical protein